MKFLKNVSCSGSKAYILQIMAFLHDMAFSGFVSQYKTPHSLKNAFRVS